MGVPHHQTAYTRRWTRVGGVIAMSLLDGADRGLYMFISGVPLDLDKLEGVRVRTCDDLIEEA